MAVAFVGCATLFVLGANGWPGKTGVSGVDFCEALRDGPIKQPANTWSNLGFLFVGLWIGWQAWRDVAARKTASWNNRLVTTVRYPASYAASVVGIGLGSSAMHASTTRWGAELDLLSMHLWGAWCIAFASTRLLRAGDRLFANLFVAQAVGLAVRIAMGHPYTVSGSDLFAAMIVAAIAIELVGRWRNRKRQRMDSQYLASAIGTFLIAYACWLISKNEGPWCDPRSFWQGHAAWHVLCSGSSLFVYLYGRSERTVTPERVE